MVCCCHVRLSAFFLPSGGDQRGDFGGIQFCAGPPEPDEDAGTNICGRFFSVGAKPSSSTHLSSLNLIENELRRRPNSFQGLAFASALSSFLPCLRCCCTFVQIRHCCCPFVYRPSQQHQRLDKVFSSRHNVCKVHHHLITFLTREEG